LRQVLDWGNVTLKKTSQKRSVPISESNFSRENILKKDGGA